MGARAAACLGVQVLIVRRLGCSPGRRRRFGSPKIAHQQRCAGTRKRAALSPSKKGRRGLFYPTAGAVVDADRSSPVQQRGVPLRTRHRGQKIAGRRGPVHPDLFLPMPAGCFKLFVKPGDTVTGRAAAVHGARPADHGCRRRNDFISAATALNKARFGAKIWPKSSTSVNASSTRARAGGRSRRCAKTPRAALDWPPRTTVRSARTWRWRQRATDLRILGKTDQEITDFQGKRARSIPLR